MQPARLQLANAVVAFFRRPLSMSVPFHVTLAREKVGHAALREGGSGSGSGSWRRRWARPARLTIWPAIAASLSSTPHKPRNELRSCYLQQRLLTIFVATLPSLSVWCSDYAVSIAQLAPSYCYRFSLTACVSPVVCFRTYVHDEWLCARIAAGSGPMIDQPGSMPFWKGTKTGRRCRNAVPIRPLFVLYPIYSHLAQDWLYENWAM